MISSVTFLHIPGVNQSNQCVGSLKPINQTVGNSSYMSNVTHADCEYQFLLCVGSLKPINLTVGNSSNVTHADCEYQFLL